MIQKILIYDKLKYSTLKNEKFVLTNFSRLSVTHFLSLAPYPFETAVLCEWLFAFTFYWIPASLNKRKCSGHFKLLELELYMYPYTPKQHKFQH